MEIGEAIKSRRQGQGLTLDGLAGRSGVSRAMLSEIERGVKNPTIRVVCQIAAGLETTVSALIGEGSARDARLPVVVRRAERQTLVDPQSGVERQLLSPAYQARGVEVFWCSIPPGARTGPFPAHRAGVVGQIVVVQGTLACTLGEHNLTLSEGDAAFFHADVPHAFANLGKESCQYVLLIDSSQAGAGHGA
jgi:transcriptional regulator with XRE-family HTH domain